MPTDHDAAAVRRQLAYGFADIDDFFAEPGRARLPVPLDEVVGRALDSARAKLDQASPSIRSGPRPASSSTGPPTGSRDQLASVTRTRATRFLISTAFPTQPT
jgi:hypothetical protein